MGGDRVSNSEHALDNHRKTSKVHRAASAQSSAHPSPEVSQAAFTSKNGIDSCAESGRQFGTPLQLRGVSVACQNSTRSKRAGVLIFLSTLLYISRTSTISLVGVAQQCSTYSTLLAHLESETCVATRSQLDRLAEAYSKDYVIPGCEAYLRTGDMKRWTPKAVLKSNTGRSGCSDCDRQFPTATALLEHLRSSSGVPVCGLWITTSSSERTDWAC